MIIIIRRAFLCSTPFLVWSLVWVEGWSSGSSRRNFQNRNVPAPSALFAKSTKSKRNTKKKAATSWASGGFAKAEIFQTKEQDDFAAFPALESSVHETIVPFLGDPSSVGDLPLEMYDRLAQIYGFDKFNYLPGDEEKQKGSKQDTMSLSDLLASPKDQRKSEFDDFLKKPSVPASDLSDLLLLATDGEPSDPSKKFVNLPLSKLPPFLRFSVLNVDPLVISIDDFFTPEECDRYIAMSETADSSSKQDAPMEVRSKTVGKDALAKAQRTSTTWFHHFRRVPELMAKASRLLGLDRIDRWEEPQTVRYRRNEKFTWHLDALAPSDDLSEKGGQRTATLLVYLTDLAESDGGATMFRDLGGPDAPLRVRPKKGSALLFFPSAGGIPNAPLDIRTLHCGEVVAQDSSNDKWIAQLWLRENTYKPTGPIGNTHEAAFESLSHYCEQ